MLNIFLVTNGRQCIFREIDKESKRGLSLAGYPTLVEGKRGKKEKETWQSSGTLRCR